jgi:hypothetical protein
MVGGEVIWICDEGAVRHLYDYKLLEKDNMNEMLGNQ